VPSAHEVCRRVARGVRPAIHLPADRQRFQPLIEACWAQDAAERPAIATVMEAIAEMMGEDGGRCQGTGFVERSRSSASEAPSIGPRSNPLLGAASLPIASTSATSTLAACTPAAAKAAGAMPAAATVAASNAADRRQALQQTYRPISAASSVGERQPSFGVSIGGVSGVSSCGRELSGLDQRDHGVSSWRSNDPLNPRGGCSSTSLQMLCNTDDGTEGSEGSASVPPTRFTSEPTTRPTAESVAIEPCRIEPPTAEALATRDLRD